MIWKWFNNNDGTDTCISNWNFACIDLDDAYYNIPIVQIIKYSWRRKRKKNVSDSVQYHFDRWTIVSSYRSKSVGWLCWGLTSQSTIFQSCRDGAIASWVFNQYFWGVKCLAQGHNTAAVGLEPRTSRSGVRHSTTEPPRSPQNLWPGILHKDPNLRKLKNVNLNWDYYKPCPFVIKLVNTDIKLDILYMLLFPNDSKERWRAAISRQKLPLGKHWLIKSTLPSSLKLQWTFTDQDSCRCKWERKIPDKTKF